MAKDKSAGKTKGKGKKGKEPPPKPKGKRYVNIKLVDFGARSRPNAGSTTAAIRGDAFLSLLLFEADKFDLVSREEGDGDGESRFGRQQRAYLRQFQQQQQQQQEKQWRRTPPTWVNRCSSGGAEPAEPPRPTRNGRACRGGSGGRRITYERKASGTRRRCR